MTSFKSANELHTPEIETELRLEMEKFILDLMFIDHTKTVSKDDIIDALELLLEKEGNSRRVRRHTIERLEWVLRRAIWSLQGQNIIDFTTSWDLELKVPDGYLQSGSRSKIRKLD
jgi:hypothetical protein